jgi:hypothetical protein
VHKSTAFAVDVLATNSLALLMFMPCYDSAPLLFSSTVAVPARLLCLVRMAPTVDSTTAAVAALLAAESQPVPVATTIPLLLLCSHHQLPLLQLLCPLRTLTPLPALKVSAVTSCKHARSSSTLVSYPNIAEQYGMYSRVHIVHTDALMKSHLVRVCTILQTLAKL